MFSCAFNTPSAQTVLGTDLGLGRGAEVEQLYPTHRRHCCPTLGNTGGTAPAVGKFEREAGYMIPTRNNHSPRKK